MLLSSLKRQVNNRRDNSNTETFQRLPFSVYSLVSLQSLFSNTRNINSDGKLRVSKLSCTSAFKQANVMYSTMYNIVVILLATNTCFGLSPLGQE